MVYRVVILNTILLAGVGSTIPKCAGGEEAESFKGTCSSGLLTSHPLNYGTISESDGVRVAAKDMSGEDYLAVVKRAKAAHLTLGSDGLLWATKPVPCDSVVVWLKANSNPKGDTLISFSNGDLSKSILGFTGVPADVDGPLFLPDGVYLGDGRPALSLNPNGAGQSCHFYFADHGTFTEGWESRLITIECNAKTKRADGHIISVDVRFDTAQSPRTEAGEKGMVQSPDASSESADRPNAEAGRAGLEWMNSAPAFCQSRPYSNLTAGQMASCDEAAFRALSKKWQNLTASNGQVYEVALDTISRDLPSNVDPGETLRAATVMVYESQGETFNPNNVFTFYFDCHDHFQTFQRDWSPVAYFPPLSVTAKIASIACITSAR
jgi:hypothetical protein